MGNNTYTAPANEQTLMSTDLNALANATTNVGGTAIDNTTNRFFYSVVELVLASVDLSAQTNPAVDLYMVPSYDGTNYADTGTDASTTILPPMQYFIASMGVAKSNAAHRAVSPHLMLDSLKYIPVVINSIGVTFPSTGNTLKIKTYTTAQ